MAGSTAPTCTTAAAAPTAKSWPAPRSTAWPRVPAASWFTKRSSAGSRARSSRCTPSWAAPRTAASAATTGRPGSLTASKKPATARWARSWPTLRATTRRLPTYPQNKANTVPMSTARCTIGTLTARHGLGMKPLPAANLRSRYPRSAPSSRTSNGLAPVWCRPSSK